MTGLQSEQAERATRTYTAAADHYLRPALGFWDRWGSATVARLALSPGDAVLDVCCGAGASALPAARAVGSSGSVLGLDLAEPLLALARQRAAEQTLENVTFRACDATATGLEDGSFDAVVCVFGVFFRRRHARVRGRDVAPRPPRRDARDHNLGPGLVRAGLERLLAVGPRARARVVRAFNPWDEITTAPALAGLLARGGVGGATVEATSGEHHELAQADDFWDVVLGSGYRGTVDALGEDQRERLRERVTSELRSLGVTRLRNDVVFARAVRD